MADQYTRPGWYPDPDGGAGERWWNGSGWSDSKRAAGAAVPPVVATPVAAPPAYSAGNPAPQRPDPYAQPLAGQYATPARSINLSQNRNATVALVLAIASFFFGILAPVAVVFGVIAVQKGRQLKAQGVAGDGLSVAFTALAVGIISSVIALVSLIGVIVAVLSVDVRN